MHVSKKGQVTIPKHIRVAAGIEPGSEVSFSWQGSTKRGATARNCRLVDQFYAELQSMGGRRWDTSSLIKRLE
jgi:AbrB family looped-hinge helix DNA binding protein